jgi:hypothetical protein
MHAEKPGSPEAYVLEMRNITKAFSGVAAS